MKKAQIAFSRRFLIVLLTTLFLSGFLLFTTVSGLTHSAISVEKDAAVLFVGDVLLGRHVEQLMDEHGEEYPFHRINSLFNSHDEVIGNFEASIPEHHKPTPDFNFTFSVRERSAELLQTQGFTGMSLANNHALDHGTSGLRYTEVVLSNAGISATGDPRSVDVYDVQWYELSGKKVALIPLNFTWGQRVTDETASVIADTTGKSDHTIAYVHWGDEYKEVASPTQVKLARSLIDHGVDVIIGHHPHVVQNIETYNEGLIFYSLGNFIFDQYWEDSVQKGLTLSLSYTDEGYGYTLIPVTSHDKRSAPRMMDNIESRSFLQELAKRSDERLQGSITRGSILHHAQIQ